MFGYIKPLTSELKIREFELYKSFYCGLCRTMGKKIAPFSRLTLSYDMVFLVLIRISLTKEPAENKSFRCKLKPAKKRNYIKSNEALLYSSCVSAILTYYKCIDDISDTKNKLKKFFLKIPRIYFIYAKKKACRLYPGLDEKIRDPLNNLHRLEENKCKSVDETASCFAQLMMNTASFSLNPPDFDSPEKSGKIRIAEQIGWHLGRWLYIIDALDDFEKDAKKKEYNPFIEYYKYHEHDRYDGGKNILLNLSEDIETIKYSLTSSLHEISIAFSLTGNSCVNAIIENIINLGLCEQQEKILNKFINLKSENQDKN